LLEMFGKFFPKAANELHFKLLKSVSVARPHMACLLRLITHN
jgi:hypothetical protein